MEEFLVVISVSIADSHGEEIQCHLEVGTLPAADKQYLCHKSLENPACIPVYVFPYYFTVTIWLSSGFLAMPFIEYDDESRIILICSGIVMRTLTFVP